MMQQERRRYRRQNSLCRVVIHSKDSKLLSSFTENISDGGIKTRLDLRLEIGSIVDLVLYLTKDDAPLIKQARVAWVKEIPESPQMTSYSTGFQFLPENK